MRVGHIVSYVSQDGAFGGPVAVAVAQATELTRRGHSVELIAGWDGKYRFDQHNFSDRLYAVTRFGGKLTSLFSPGLARHIWKSNRSVDVLHIHLGRDLVTTTAGVIAIARGIPFIVQTHGMIMPDNRVIARIFDWLFTRKILARSHKVLTLSPAEEEGVYQVARGRTSTERVTNGVQAVNTLRKSAIGKPKVIFLARLHPRKRVMVFAQAAALLLRGGYHAEFSIYGPDEGDLNTLQSFLEIEGLNGLNYEGPIEPGTAAGVLANADVYVLPSFGEVVPMTVLEAMAVGTPVVMTKDCAMANDLSDAEAAMVTNGSVDEIASAIAALLDDRELASTVSLRATALLTGLYSVEAIAQRLETVYAAATVA